MASDEYRQVVCSNCGKGDWSDHEPGDALRCPFCEEYNTLTFREDFERGEDRE